MKNVLFVLFMIYFWNTTEAQEINFGIKGGVNFATLTGDAGDLDSRTAFHIGVITEIKISEKFSFQPELLYSSQGAKDSKFDEELKTNYLYLPLMLKYYIADGVSIQAGPQIGLLLSANSEFDGEEEDIKEFLNDLDFGLNFGIGYAMNNGLNFELRYNIGISNVDDESDDFEVRNGVFQLSVGYFFF
ncbi:MAG: porin family protein [Psychroserpens sp.]|uniref:porin family protein n=1 Tax=Psychroserpens sp. TaxID=2020870 RepID=UPI0030027DC9